MSKIIKSNKWKYTIGFKSFLKGDTSLLCKRIKIELKRIQTILEKSNVIEDDKYDFSLELEELINHFDFVNLLYTKEIPVNEWEDYSFDGNFESLIKDYLEELYDLGNKRIVCKSNISQKFMWVD